MAQEESASTEPASTTATSTDAEEYAVTQITEDEARELYANTPQSVKNIFIFYFSHLYSCMSKTVEQNDEDTVDSAYFDIFVDQAIYQDIPTEITSELPSEFQEYLKALLGIWTAALTEADALSGDDATEEAFQDILDRGTAAELELLDRYPEAVSLNEKLMPHLVTILFDECEMDSKLETASESLQTSTSTEKEYYAKVLDFMGETLFALIQ